MKDGVEKCASVVGGVDRRYTLQRSRDEGARRGGRVRRQETEKGRRRMSTDGVRNGVAVGERQGNEDLVGVMNGDVHPPPNHLAILVNGIIGCAEDWKFAAERFQVRLKHQVAVHCSTSSAALQTFHGVDVMGKRLAAEVRETVNKTPGVTRISFIAHSLGGLVARYAIAELYRPGDDCGEDANEWKDNKKNTERVYSGPTIAGLQPINFISVASPHLGCSSSQQLPFLFGIEVLEKTAPYMAHWFVGQTGKHLFLSDGSDSQPPLLRRMVTDCGEGKFMLSLQAFENRTAYANVDNDQMVGWRTASIRRQSELPKVVHKPVDLKYPHIVREEEPVSTLGEGATGVRLKSEVSDLSKSTAANAVEEEIISALTRMSWRRVDVSFQGSDKSYQAHNIIQVKNPKVHYEGADVIEHIIDRHFIRELPKEWSGREMEPRWVSNFSALDKEHRRCVDRFSSMVDKELSFWSQLGCSQMALV